MRITSFQIESQIELKNLKILMAKLRDRKVDDRLYLKLLYYRIFYSIEKVQCLSLTAF